MCDAYHQEGTRGARRREKGGGLVGSRSAAPRGAKTRGNLLTFEDFLNEDFLGHSQDIIYL